MTKTVKLDDDVAALLERVQSKRNATRKEVVNEALRIGLQAMSASPAKRRPFRTKTLVNGPASIPNLDNIAEVLALIEGEDYK